MTKKQIKNLGLGILVLPCGLILMFLLGETIGGDLSGLGHLIQLIPLLLMAYVSWKWPVLGGVLLVGGGLSSGILYLMAGRFPLSTVLAVEGTIFVPLVVAGVLLITSQKKKMP